MEKSLKNIPTTILQYIHSDVAYHYRIVPFNFEEGVLHIICDVENSANLSSELEILLGIKNKLFTKKAAEVSLLLETNYRKRDNKSIINYSDDFLLNIIHEAKEIGSSDVHFEIYENQNRVRFRIDGKLIEKYIIPQQEYPKIINRIKIMGGLDISEKRLPQDGRINLKTTTEDFDIRVSSLPTLHGEKLVLRILSKNNARLQLENLGFSEQELTIYKDAIKKPNGIILISGPTGSGKTTTLYATLKLLNTDDTNILTIEDPIEYTLEGINQVQLKENIGLDFASTLRTFLRQDPDIIMVGEIRDVATANMAIRAALTGHLVLSTIHTNSAWATISRLLDMGVPSFLLASTLNVSVAQRLVRKLCDSCKKNTPFEENSFTKELKISLKSSYKALGCPNCYHTGYKGRKAIYEIIPITSELVKNIQNKDIDITDYLKEKNIYTLKDNALNLVKQGITSFDEIYPLLIN